jgi:hypothetical protein
MNPDVVKAGILHARASGHSTGKVQGAAVVGGLALVVVGLVVYVSSQQTKTTAALATNEGRAQGYYQALEEQKSRDVAAVRSRVMV